MKYRNQFLKYKLNYHMSPDSAEGGGGGQGGEGGDANGGGSNGDNNLTSFDDIWQDNNTEGEGTGQQKPAQQTATAGATPEETFNRHVEGIDFTGGLNVQELQQAIQNGDQEAFSKAFRSVGEVAYRQAMIDLNKVMNSRLDGVKTEMSQTMSTAQATDKAVSQLNGALPYTKEPMYKPVADEVFSRFLRQKGMTVDKAIEKTGEYFSKFSSDVSKLNPKPPSSRSGGGFGEISEDTGGDGDGQDWMDFLGSPQ